MWDSPGRGIEPMFPAPAGRLRTSGPPEKFFCAIKDVSPVGFESEMFHPSGAGLKSCGAWCGVETCSFSGRKKVLVLNSDYRLSHWGWGLWWDCISASSTHFVGFFFFFFPMCRSSSPSFRFCCCCCCFPEEIVPYLAVDLVCLLEKISSGTSYIMILNQPYCYNFII